MINLDETALICDLAETYHILDYRSQPVKLVAALSAGLRDNSRIKMRFADLPVDPNMLMLATIADRIEAFRYSFLDTKEMPPLLVDELLGNSKTNTNGVAGFATPIEFESALAKIRGE